MEKNNLGGGTPGELRAELVDRLHPFLPRIQTLITHIPLRNKVMDQTTTPTEEAQYHQVYNSSADLIGELLYLMQTMHYIIEDMDFIFQGYNAYRRQSDNTYDSNLYQSKLVWACIRTLHIIDKDNPFTDELPRLSRYHYKSLKPHLKEHLYQVVQNQKVPKPRSGY